MNCISLVKPRHTENNAIANNIMHCGSIGLLNFCIRFCLQLERDQFWSLHRDTI